MSKKLILLVCLFLFVVFASAAPKNASKKTSSKKTVKKTEVVVKQPKKEKKKKKEEKKVEKKEENDDDEFISAPEEPSETIKNNGDGDEENASQFTSAQQEERLSRQKFEEDQRLDEYANSLRRRDWLKDRLILQFGMGSRYPFMGETGMGMGFGGGVEYISRWHAALYGSVGYLPKGKDNVFDDIDLQGGFGYKIGLNYYLLPKNPLHLGISVSYGTVYFDHDIRPDKNNMRPLITVNGFQFDALITYLTNEWYYLQFSFGMYYAPKLKSKDLSNPSFDVTSKTDETPVSIVVNPDGMNKTGVVFGIAVGYAFPEFFPDDTERRRREREKERAAKSSLDD